MSWGSVEVGLVRRQHAEYIGMTECEASKIKDIVRRSVAEADARHRDLAKIGRTLILCVSLVKDRQTV